MPVGFPVQYNPFAKDSSVPLIESSLFARASEIAVDFQAAQPFRHADIENFFDASLCRQLLADFPRFEDRHALNERGEVGGKAVRMDVRDISGAYRELDRYLQTPEFLGFVSAITGIPDLLYDPDYIGGGTHENRDGQSLDAHVDFNYHPRTRWHRRLNLIVYLNPQWEADWGGALELHSNPWKDAGEEIVRIEPTFNRCVIFETTETSWHGFSQIRLPAEVRDVSRKSFAIYLYTRERPVAETAPPHATIYVPESLPTGWQAGRVLTPDDLAELHTRFARMRTQLRYLYDREQQFGAQIETLERALDEARAAQRLELQGYATQAHGATGLWPDGWAGAELGAEFVPTRKTHALVLDLWIPSGLGDPQELDIELARKRYTQTAQPGTRTPVHLPLRAKPGTPIALRIRAARTWVPAAAGTSGDARELAFKVVSARLDH